MNISTTVLQAYDLCKQAKDAEFCKQQAMSGAPKAIKTFLDGYDLCLMTGQKDLCQRAFAYDIPTPPVVPFVIGIVIGWIIKRR